MYINYNNNPLNKRVGDCVIRAVSTVLGESWDDVYNDLTDEGFRLKDMPSANHVWGSYLTKWGFYRNVIPNTCPTCYTIKDFCKEHQRGTYLLATGTHVVAVMDGDYYDTWNSGDEIPIYYWKRSDISGI